MAPEVVLYSIKSLLILSNLSGDLFLFRREAAVSRCFYIIRSGLTPRERDKVRLVTVLPISRNCSGLLTRGGFSSAIISSIQRFLEVETANLNWKYLAYVPLFWCGQGIT